MNLSISVSYYTKSSLNGTITYANNGGFATFFSTYDFDYEITPALALILGNYSGFSFGMNGEENATVNVSSTGAITGSNGCT